MALKKNHELRKIPIGTVVFLLNCICVCACVAWRWVLVDGVSSCVYWRREKMNANVSCFYLNRPIKPSLVYEGFYKCVSRYAWVFTRVFPAIVFSEIPPTVGYCGGTLSPIVSAGNVCLLGIWLMTVLLFRSTQHCLLLHSVHIISYCLRFPFVFPLRFPSPLLDLQSLPDHRIISRRK